MSRTPPAWPRPDGGGGASAPTNGSPSGPPSRVGASRQRARVRRPSSPPPWGRSPGHRRTAASQAARATAPEARGAARSARCRCADASHPGPRARVRCSGRATARSSAGQSSSPPRHPRSCDPALTARSPERAASRSDPGPTGASLPDRPRSDDQQPAPWLASAPHGAPAYPLFNNPGILNPSPSPGARMSHTLADRRVLRLIERWLKAGLLESGRWEPVEVGTPQGSGISPILANVFLHYAVDLWVHRWRRRSAAGQVIICRYADDLVIGCQHEAEARQLLAELKDRLAQFGLSLHEGKTRLIEFGRFATERRAAAGQRRPETFDFLG